MATEIVYHPISMIVQPVDPADDESVVGEECHIVSGKGQGPQLYARRHREPSSSGDPPTAQFSGFSTKDESM
jgi:hypothetical protein